MKLRLERILGVFAVAVVGAGMALALVPKPVPVEAASVQKGALTVTVEGQGKTRVVDRFVVSAPLGGNVPRLELHAGDAVAEGQVLVAISPVDAPLLDPRSRAQADAQVAMARAARAQADARIGVAQAASEHAEKEVERARSLAQAGAVAPAQLEDAEVSARTARRELESSRFGAQVARYQLESALAAVARAAATGSAGAVSVRSPVRGRVLRVAQENAGVVQVGAPLLEIGDPTTLEVVVDLLSTDVVSVQAAQDVALVNWGGEGELRGRVRRVEPSGFTKLSALGIEEQRVNVLVDFVDPQERWRSLGDGYGVEARITVWQGTELVTVPVSALFRHGERWAVFVVADGHARLRDVDVGRRNDRIAAVGSGLAAGERVVVHPGDKVGDGVKVEVR